MSESCVTGCDMLKAWWKPLYCLLHKYQNIEVLGLSRHCIVTTVHIRVCYHLDATKSIFIELNTWQVLLIIVLWALMGKLSFDSRTNNFVFRVACYEDFAFMSSMCFMCHQFLSSLIWLTQYMQYSLKQNVMKLVIMYRRFCTSYNCLNDSLVNTKIAVFAIF